MAWISVSWRLSLNNLAGKRWRTALMIGAVGLAAALVVAVSCAISSAQYSLEESLTRFLGASDARVVHPFNGRFPAGLLERVRSWPEVEAATGRFGTQVNIGSFRDPDERVVADAVGVEFDLVPRFRGIEMLRGKLPEAPNEVLIDEPTVIQLQLDVGDVMFLQDSRSTALKVTGVYKRQQFGPLSRPRIEMSLETLQLSSGYEDALTSIYIMLADATEVDEFCEARSANVPPQVSLERSEMMRAGFDRQLYASRLGMLSAAVLTFMCASFIIVTGLTTSVSERQRELAVTRCVGGARHQLVLAQLMHGGTISALGMTFGVPLGIGLAWIVVWWFQDTVNAGLRLSGTGLALAIGGSLATGVLGAAYPALLASRVPPLQALTARAHPASIRGIALLLLVGLALMAAQASMMRWPDLDQRFTAYVIVGVPAAFIGAFLIAVPLLIAVTRLLGLPLAALLRLPADALTGGLLASPYRNGFTAGALMVAITVLITTWSNNLSLLNQWVGRMEFADGMAMKVTGISEEQVEAITNLPAVVEVCPLGYIPLRVFNRQVFGTKNLGPRTVKGFCTDPEVFFRLNAIQWVQGDPTLALPRLALGEGVIVADRFLTSKEIGLGDVLTLGSGEIRHDYEILGVVDVGWLEVTAQMFGMRSAYMEVAVSGVFLDIDTVHERYGNTDIHFLQVELSDEVSDDDATASVLEAAPGVAFWTSRDISARITDVAKTIMSLYSTVAFAAMFLAAIAMGNVILANIRGRSYEFGVLRSIGGGRWLVARLIFGEAALIALTACLIGTGLGMQLAWAGLENYRTLAGLDLELIFPTLPALLGWAALLLMTLLAALPGVLTVVRPHPATLIAGGRNG